MHVAEVTAFGGPEVLRLDRAPRPRARRPGEVVVRIRAANVNPTDLSVRSGQARQRLPELQPPFVPGWDLAGEVTAVGSEATRLRPRRSRAGDDPLRAHRRAGGRLRAGRRRRPGLARPALHGHRRRHRRDAAAQRADRAPGARHHRRAAGRDPARHRRQRRGRRLRHPARGPRGTAACWPRPPTTTRTGSPRSGATEVLPRATDLATIGPVDAVLDAVPLGPRRPPPRCATAGSPSSPARRAAPSRRAASASRPCSCSPNAEQLRALTADLEAGRLRTRIAEVLPLAQAARAHELNEAGGLRGKVLLAP